MDANAYLRTYTDRVQIAFSSSKEPLPYVFAQDLVSARRLSLPPRRPPLHLNLDPPYHDSDVHPHTVTRSRAVYGVTRHCGSPCVRDTRVCSRANPNPYFAPFDQPNYSEDLFFPPNPPPKHSTPQPTHQHVLTPHESDKKLVPPLDVDWAWHCHCLCPGAYKTDCLAAVERQIDRPVFTCADERIMAREQVCPWWSVTPLRFGNVSLSLMTELRP